MCVNCLISLNHKSDGIDLVFFFFQAEDGIRDLVRSRGLGDVYKRQYIERTDFNYPSVLWKRFQY